MGVIDSGATGTCVDARICDRADLGFSGESDRLKCVHLEHVVVLDTYFGRIDICGGTEHTTVFALNMRPEYERVGINAILGWDVLGDLRVTIDGPTRTGAIELQARA